jgi:acyl-CoA thioester hydrolase
VEEWDFQCVMTVRDYELDMQGIVHHSVYINYLEYCRSLYAKSLGVDVHEYHRLGYDVVIVALDQEYKSSLQPYEEFYVTVKAGREGRLRMIFNQEIRRVKDHSLVLKAKVTAVWIDLKTHRPCMPKMLEGIFENKMGSS